MGPGAKNVRQEKPGFKEKCAGAFIHPGLKSNRLLPNAGKQRALCIELIDVRQKFLISNDAECDLESPKDQTATAHMDWIQQLQFANWRRVTGCLLEAYLLGCFATGYYLVRARTGNDLRKIESGTVGARNAGRALGRMGFVLTLLGDFGKGALAVWIAWQWTGDNHLALVALLAVVVGHVWPLQLRFHGGKGVATSLGALLVFDYRVALIFPVLFLIGFALARKSLLPAMIAFACLPMAAWCFDRDNFTVAGLAILAAIILFAHRRNLTEEFIALAGRRAATPKPEQPKL
jgi:acyl phosphate:glycerol-3-phosphate acyltransferase